MSRSGLRETTDVLIHFDEYPGRGLIDRHQMVYGDRGMMANFEEV